MFANMDMYRIENVVCYPFRTANLVDNGTKEGQIGEGCMGSLGGQGAGTAKAVEIRVKSRRDILRLVLLDKSALACTMHLTSAPHNGLAACT